MFLDYFIKNIQRGDPWKILKKTKKNFFTIPPKILHNTHMRSHKKFRAKKMIFRGVFRGGLSERKKIQSGVWCPIWEPPSHYSMNVPVTHAPWLSCSIHPASKYTKYGNIVTDCDGVRLDCVMANIGGQ